MIRLDLLRTLTLSAPSRPGRPAHVSAASGLVRAGDRLYVVADDENHLAVFPAEGSEPGRLKPLFPGTLPVAAEARKRNKPDVECIARLPAFRGHPHGALLVLGSCSKRSRCSGAILGLGEQGELDGSRTEIDLSPLHDAYSDRLALNVEGALVMGDELVLLQRGHKSGAPNARIRMHLEATLDALLDRGRLETESLIHVEEVEIGLAGNLPLCFTDGAALDDGRMLFTAIAEDSLDGYLDGQCTAAAIGAMTRDGAIEFVERIDPRYKVEGIDARVEGGVIRALLVTDADDAAVPSSLLACEIRQDPRSC
jgi:hypothetical protein